MAAKLGRAEPVEVNESPDAEAALEGGIGRFDLHCRCTGGTRVLVGFASVVRCSGLKGFIEALAI